MGRGDVAVAIGTNIGATRHQHAVHAHARAVAAAPATSATQPSPARFDVASSTLPRSSTASAPAISTIDALAGMGCSTGAPAAATTSTAGGGTAGPSSIGQALESLLATVGAASSAISSALGGAGALAAPTGTPTTSQLTAPAATPTTATLGLAPRAGTNAATAATATGATGTGAALLGQVAATVSGSSIAQQVLGALGQHGARIDVVDDAAFNAKYPGAGGVYLPDEDRIVLPKSAASDPKKLALVLVHEGTHWLQDHIGTGKLDSLGGPLAQALQGSNALQVGVGGPNSKDAEWHDEAQAYFVESVAAHQVGLADPGLGSDARTGATLTYAQTLARVKSTPLYQ